MVRRLVPLLFVLLAAASPMLAQFGGMGRRYPGGGNPYPQQVPQQTTPKVFGPTEDLTGTIQSINDSSIVLDEGDDRIVLVQIQKGTKYLSTADKVKASDFEPGDHVTVEATRDSDDHYYSKSITMNKKGTAADKAAEMQASSGHSDSGSTGGGPSASDDDPNRPRLHRANSDGGSTDTSSTSGTSSGSAGAGSATAPTSASVDDDPNRPRLHRAGSDSTSGSASSDTVTTSQRPAVTSGDDSGPPVLRRGPAPSDSSGSNPQIASASAPGSRPSLSASDDNGVTRLPDVPPPPSGASDDSRGDTRTASRGTYSGGGDPIIEQARDAAFTFSETLPNYVVKQLTNRYASETASRGRTSWTPLDIVTTDLVYEDGKERYTNVMVNGKPTKYIEQTGSWSEGEFASMLQAILAPQTNADFRNQRPVTIVNRPAYKYDYTVEQPRSTWTLHADGQTYAPSYTGSIWVDKQTYRVLRIEIAARNLPRNFPLDSAESSIDYDFVMIGDKKVLLPADADSLSCVRGTSDCTKNHTEFHNYRKYGADSSITFDDPAK
jgi:hypothetical protein